MKKQKLIYVLFLFFVCTILFSCAGSMPKADMALDQKAKAMAVPEDKALVYVIRPTTYGFAVGMDVFCDNKKVGTTTGQRYLYMLLNPGRHQFMSKAENKSEQILNLKAGMTYYLEQQVKMGFLKARNNLVLLSAAEGREKLEKCNLIKDFSPSGDSIQ
jgi:hypothetical protein